MTIEDRDEFGRLASDALPWRSVSSLAQAGELTARWLEGRSTFVPMYADTAPDEETRPLVGSLAAINRSGFWTDQSQPGVPLSATYPQRAFVSGYCDEGMADSLLNKLSRTDIVVVSYGVGAVGESSIPVTLCEGKPCTWLGRSPDLFDEETFDFYAFESNPAFVEAIRDAQHLQIFDPVWGREDLLFTAILDAVS
jgi:hypothetical protein